MLIFPPASNPKYLNVALDPNLVKRILKQSIVANELVVIFGLPVDLTHRDLARMHYIKNLAIHGP